MSKVRLGVIGAGSWAISSHMPNFAKHDDVEFVAVSRHGSDALQRVKDKFGFTHASEDYRDVLDAGVDVVLVSSPSGLHYEHAKAALQSGANVLIEKPVTIKAADAWDLVETEKATGQHVTCAYGWNFSPMLHRAKELMTDIGIGQIEAVSIVMASQTRELLSNTGAYPEADKDTVPEERTWTDPALSGGGYGQAQLSHAFGMSLWLLNQRMTGAFSLMKSVMGAPVDMHDAISVKYTDDSIGTVFGASNHVGAANNRHQLIISAYGDEGQFRCDVERDQVWLYRPDGTDIDVDLPPNAGHYDCIGPVETILDLTRGKSVRNDAPLELGARTVEALEIIYESANEGRWVQR
jgi:predicted dehydrogenase